VGGQGEGKVGGVLAALAQAQEPLPAQRPHLGRRLSEPVPPLQVPERDAAVPLARRRAGSTGTAGAVLRRSGCPSGRGGRRGGEGLFVGDSRQGPSPGAGDGRVEMTAPAPRGGRDGRAAADGDDGAVTQYAAILVAI